MKSQYFLIISTTDTRHYFDVVDLHTLKIVKKHSCSYCYEPEEEQTEIKRHLSEYDFVKTIYVG